MTETLGSTGGRIRRSLLLDSGMPSGCAERTLGLDGETRATGAGPGVRVSGTTTFATNMVAAALSLANVLITARQLGPSGRGELAFLTTVAMLTAALSSFGVEEAHANLAATMPRVRRTLASNSLAFGLVFGALAAGFVALLMALFRHCGRFVASCSSWPSSRYRFS